ncbi:TlpA disulfide reductase family protein [Oceanithermus sp.]|uniref:TlpA family protein disulfide reductase n=1 Tax=Oceanithermus sp. TaxID=2268145 RepID=UPI00257C11FC|nr:TlpA disulfide reductase family protein [Oceanithermus sp.]
MPPGRLLPSLVLALFGLALAAVPGSTSWPAPPFSAERLDRPGAVLDLAETLGRRPVVLNFWASWCVPCRVEAPVLRDAERRYRGRVLFVGVNLQDTRKGAETFMETFFWTFPNVRDPRGAVARRYRVGGIPTTVFIDAGGRVVRVWTGPLDPERLEAFLRALIGTPEG